MRTSTHGKWEGIDGMVTPCFDSNGEHNEPDEEYPCGVEEEHLHDHHQEHAQGI